MAVDVEEEDVAGDHREELRTRRSLKHTRDKLTPLCTSPSAIHHARRRSRAVPPNHDLAVL